MKSNGDAMINMPKRLAFLGLWFVIAQAELLNAGTSGFLEGTVKEKDTGNPLMGVNVLILETRLGAVTDGKGFFRIYNIPAGTITVQFRMVGFRMVNYEGVTIRPDLKTRLTHVEMEPVPFEMEPVTVSAEHPLIQKDATGSTVRVPKEMLDRLPVTTLMDVLPMQAGVTGEGNVRGGKETDVLYLIDGLPIRDAVGGGVGIHLPRSAVTEMEIQTGGFESEYGDAMSGVVNIITKGGGNRFESTVRGETDDYPGITQKDRAKLFEASFSGTLRRDRIFYLLAADGQLTDTRWWQDFRRAFPSPVSRETSGFGRFDWQFSPSLRLSAQLLYANKRWKDYEFSWRYNLTGLPARNRESVWGTVLWSHVLSKRIFYTVDLNFYQIGNRIGTGPKEAMDPTPYAYDFFLQYVLSGNRSWWMNTVQRIGVIRGSVTGQAGARSLVKGGFELHVYDINGDVVKMEPQMTYFGKPILDRPLLNFSTKYRYFPVSGSFFLQDKFEVGEEGGTFSAGIRYDFLDPRASRPTVEWIPSGQKEYAGELKKTVRASFKGVVSPRFGFSAPVSEKSFFFANIGIYSQFPMFHYLYAGLDNVTLRNGMNALKGNPDLKPETTLGFEVGVKRRLLWGGVFSMTLFAKQSRNQIDTKTFVPSNSRVAGDYGFAEYVNNDWAEARGIEFNLTKERGRHITGGISYVFMNAKGMSATSDRGIQYFQWGFPLTSNLYFLSWDQRHTWKASLDIRSNRGLDAGLYWEYHSPRPFTYFPSRDGIAPDDPLAPFVPNNERMRDAWNLNVKVSQTFRIHLRMLRRIVLYADARNVFNRKNVLWMDASGRIGGELEDPAAYGAGRRTRAGLQFEF